MERLEAAIAKLAKLREDSTQPTGASAWYQGRERKRYERAVEVYSGPDESTPGSCDIVQFYNPADAELVVTLHRTIDTQLAFLREARFQLTHEGEHVKGFLEHELNLFMRLADAILDN